jgi:hypothetical protein
MPFAPSNTFSVMVAPEPSNAPKKGIRKFIDLLIVTRRFTKPYIFCRMEK